MMSRTERWLATTMYDRLRSTSSAPCTSSGQPDAASQSRLHPRAIRSIAGLSGLIRAIAMTTGPAISVANTPAESVRTVRMSVCSSLISSDVNRATLMVIG